MFNLLLTKKMRLVILSGAMILGLLFGLFGCLFLWLEHFGSSPGPHDVRVELTIEHGKSPRAIARQLEGEGLISSARMFYWYLRYIEQCPSCLKAGDYILEGKMSPESIIAMLRSGRQREYRFTIPEGARKEDIARIIAGAGLATSQQVLDAMSDPALMYDFGVPSGGNGRGLVHGGMEGYLFPDTYQFPKGTPVVDMLWRMRLRLDQMIDENMQARMQELGWNLHKVLTFASLIERETGASEERAIISSVFHNRLKKGMKLQTDPTTIYGLDVTGRIQPSHVRQAHAYNTYTNYGLPPGPIASPGKRAIEAVLWPAKTNYLFFVSKGNGRHEFCANYGCHKNGIQQLQRVTRKRPVKK